MSDYEILVARVGRAAVDRLVQNGLFNDDSDHAYSDRTCRSMLPTSPACNAQVPAGPKARGQSCVQLGRKLPHAIPYQGSKRSLAPLIARYVPTEIDRWYEPFAGSAAMTIWAASRGIARKYIIGDALAPLVDLWKIILSQPEKTALRYRNLWNGQACSDDTYFYAVRDRFNLNQDPVDLLYLICRCVKNAVRFNRRGGFMQSVDKRRLGMNPDKMEAAIDGIASLLNGKVEVRHGDWMETCSDASHQDFVYMDPPYFGTTVGRDKRYAQQLHTQPLVSGLSQILSRNIRFILSYDGMTGEKTYAEPLPIELGLTQLLLYAGKSSQATLVGRSEDTVESLYLSPGLGRALNGVVRRYPIQPSLDLTRAR